MDVERERLSELYKTYTDAQLVQLSRDEPTLTDAAQTALTEELTARGLEYGPASEELETGFAAGIPGMFPSSAAVMEKALEPGGESEDGMAELISFFDGHELTRACEALDAAGIHLEMRQREGNAMTGTASWYEVWVADENVERSQQVLREKLGLFPVAEQATGSAEDDGTTLPIALMETRAEADAAVKSLKSAGFDARTVPDQEENGFSVEVPPSQRERALAALASELHIRAN